MTPGVISKTATLVNKVLTSDARRFSNECGAHFEKIKGGSGRTTQPVEGAGDWLALDTKLQLEIERVQEIERAPVVGDVVTEREALLNERLVLHISLGFGSTHGRSVY